MAFQIIGLEIGPWLVAVRKILCEIIKKLHEYIANPILKIYILHICTFIIIISIFGISNFVYLKKVTKNYWNLSRLITNQ